MSSKSPTIFLNVGKAQKKINTGTTLAFNVETPRRGVSVSTRKLRTQKGKTATFYSKVLLIVRKIPKGKILTYGQVATLAGVPRAARIVGGILHHSGIRKKLPWQRVINSQGKISTYRVGFGEHQRRLLEDEGVVFNRSGAVNLKKHQWHPSDALMKKFQMSDELSNKIKYLTEGFHRN